LLNERHGESVEAKINAYLSKARSISRWKSLTKGGKSTSTKGWRWWRVVMVLANGVGRVLGANACNVWT
jgi:hypothetical protein